MKTVAIPVLEGHSTVAVFPHKRQNEKVISKQSWFDFNNFYYIYRTSVLSMWFSVKMSFPKTPDRTSSWNLETPMTTVFSQMSRLTEEK